MSYSSAEMKRCILLPQPTGPIIFSWVMIIYIYIYIYIYKMNKRDKTNRSIVFMLFIFFYCSQLVLIFGDRLEKKI